MATLNPVNKVYYHINDLCKEPSILNIPHEIYTLVFNNIIAQVENEKDSFFIRSRVKDEVEDWECAQRRRVGLDCKSSA